MKRILKRMKTDGTDRNAVRKKIEFGHGHERNLGKRSEKELGADGPIRWRGRRGGRVPQDGRHPGPAFPLRPSGPLPERARRSFGALREARAEPLRLGPGEDPLRRREPSSPGRRLR